MVIYMFGKFLLSENNLTHRLHRPYSQSLYHSILKKERKSFLGAILRGFLFQISLSHNHATCQYPILSDTMEEAMEAKWPQKHQDVFMEDR